MPKEPRLTVRKSAQTPARADPLAHSQPNSFECTACLDTVRSGKPISMPDSSTICVKPDFSRALKDESAFPARWGGIELDIKKFSKHFSKSFVHGYLAKKKEYGIRSVDRLYCAGSDENSTPCNRFLGARGNHRNSQRCSNCRAMTCADCSTEITNTPAIRHKCPEPKGEETVDPLDGLVKGQDYQRCPSCKTAIQLRDGCNHITCQVPSCGAHFCYLCGETANGNSGHWRYGKPCPLYNRPGVANPIFDGAGQVVPGVEGLRPVPNDNHIGLERLGRLARGVGPIEARARPAWHPMPVRRPAAPLPPVEVLEALGLLPEDFEGEALEEDLAAEAQRRNEDIRVQEARPRRLGERHEIERIIFLADLATAVPASHNQPRIREEDLDAFLNEERLHDQIPNPPPLDATPMERRRRLARRELVAMRHIAENLQEPFEGLDLALVAMQSLSQVLSLYTIRQLPLEEEVRQRAVHRLLGEYNLRVRFHVFDMGEQANQRLPRLREIARTLRWVPDAPHDPF